MNWMRFGITLLGGSLVITAIALLFYEQMSTDTANTAYFFQSAPIVFCLCLLGIVGGIAAMVGHER